MSVQLTETFPYLDTAGGTVPGWTVPATFRVRRRRLEGSVSANFSTDWPYPTAALSLGTVRQRSRVERFGNSPLCRIRLNSANGNCYGAWFDGTDLYLGEELSGGWGVFGSVAHGLTIPTAGIVWLNTEYTVATTTLRAWMSTDERRGTVAAQISAVDSTAQIPAGTAGFSTFGLGYVDAMIVDLPSDPVPEASYKAVIVGDSRHNNFAVSTGFEMWRQVADLLGLDWYVKDLSVTGATLQDAIDNFGDIVAEYDPTRTANVLVILRNVNDGFGGSTGAQIAALTRTLSEMAIPLGYRIVVSTVGPRGDVGGFQTIMDAANPTIKAEFRDYANALVSPHLHPLMGSIADTLNDDWYVIDGSRVHYADEGVLQLAPQVTAAILEAVAQVGVAEGADTAGILAAIAAMRADIPNAVWNADNEVYANDLNGMGNLLVRDLSMIIESTDGLSSSLAALPAALAGTMPINVISPATPQSLDLYRGDAYTTTQGNRNLAFTYQTGEPWPDTISECHFYAKPRTQTLDRASNAASITDLPMTVTQATGPSRAVLLELNATTVATLTAGLNHPVAYDFWVVANKGTNTLRATLRSGTLTLRPDYSAT